MDTSPNSRQEHILACLSSSPSNERIIRTAARMAEAFEGRFTALYVQTPDSAAALPGDRRRLEENRALAQYLGAVTETVYGEDVPYQIAEYARRSGVTRIVLGHSAARRRLGRPPLTETLLSYAPGAEIHIIPDQRSQGPYRPRRALPSGRAAALDLCKSLLILLAATALSLLFRSLGFTEPNIIMVYILGVVVTSVVTAHPVYGLACSVASVFVFNFLFTVPRFSLAAYGTGYPVTFAVMFLTAYITGAMANRYKAQARQSAGVARRVRILFDANMALSRAETAEDIVDTAAAQMGRLLGRDIVFFLEQEGALGKPRLFPAGDGTMAAPSPAEMAAAEKAVAGAGDGQAEGGTFRYFPLKVSDRVYGAAGVDTQAGPLDGEERDILLAILTECALALENEKNHREKKAAAVLAESEQLRANLLRTISHDLRTPLTTISGNAGNLLTQGDKFAPEVRRQIYADIYDDAQWLTQLVENLLASTRIEDGRMALHTAPELLSDIVDEAVAHMRPRAHGRAIHVRHGDDLVLVRVDARLIAQVIDNLVDNALKYSDGDITVSDGVREGMGELSVADTGKGIPDDEKEKVFEKFYCSGSAIADNRRRLGLGLYLCRAIVRAHGGEIAVEDNAPHGAVFRFTLPIEEVDLHEHE